MTKQISRVSFRISDNCGYSFSIDTVKEIIIGPQSGYWIEKGDKKYRINKPCKFAFAEMRQGSSRIQVEALISEETYREILELNPNIKITNKCQNQDKEKTEEF